jgi:hypothetical protein
MNQQSGLPVLVTSDPHAARATISRPFCCRSRTNTSIPLAWDIVLKPRISQLEHSANAEAGRSAAEMHIAATARLNQRECGKSPGNTVVHAKFRRAFILLSRSVKRRWQMPRPSAVRDVLSFQLSRVLFIAQVCSTCVGVTTSFNVASRRAVDLESSAICFCFRVPVYDETSDMTAYNARACRRRGRQGFCRYQQQCW